jgi:uncharacterized membrane protein SirB2
MGLHLIFLSSILLSVILVPLRMCRAEQNASRMTPAVIDTGVLVSGIYWRHEAHQCVRAWLLGVLRPVVSQAIFAEYE